MSRFWSSEVHDLTPYVPGEQPQLEKLIKLNTNENPYAPSPKAIEAIKQHADDDLRKYPDPQGLQLKQAIADYYQLDNKQVFVCNSSDEVLAHTFKGLLKHDDAILFPDLTYGFYPVFCGLFGIDFKQIPLNQTFDIDLDDYCHDQIQRNGGVIFANPNAPTGKALSLQKIENFLQKNTESVVVVDEAYVDFGAQTAISLIGKYDNLVVVQTFSKSRSLAGLRVGFACANSGLIEAMERVKNSFNPYPLDRLAIAGGVAAMQDKDYFELTCNKIIATRERSTRMFVEMGFEVLPSSSNFVLVKHSTMQAKELFSQLRERSIVVRYFAQERIANYLRISIGTNEEMDALFLAIEDILASN